jgi:hypothetical protein
MRDRQARQSDAAQHTRGSEEPGTGSYVCSCDRRVTARRRGTGQVVVEAPRSRWAT